MTALYLALALCTGQPSTLCTPEMQEAATAMINCNQDTACAQRMIGNRQIEVTQSGVTIFRGR